MRNVAKNTFNSGLVTDLSPDNTSNDVITNALNATLLTNNGDNMLLQQDMGNVRVDGAYLPQGYIPVGSVEHGGIIYIASVNPETKVCLIGSFPSPDFANEVATRSNSNNSIEINLPTVNNPSVFLKFDLELSPGDKYCIWFDQFNETKLPYEFYISSIDDYGKITHLSSYGTGFRTSKPETSSAITDTNSVDYTRYKFNDDNFKEYTGKNKGTMGIHIVLPTISNFSAYAATTIEKNGDVKVTIQAEASNEQFVCDNNKGMKVAKRNFNVCTLYLVLEESTPLSLQNNGTRKVINVPFEKTYSKNSGVINYTVTPIYYYSENPIANEGVPVTSKSISLTIDTESVLEPFCELSTWKYQVYDNYVILNYGFRTLKNTAAKKLILTIAFMSTNLGSDLPNVFYTSSRTNLNGSFLDSILFDIPVDYLKYAVNQTNNPAILKSKKVYLAMLVVKEVIDEEEVEVARFYRWMHTSKLMNQYYREYQDFNDVTKLTFNYAPVTQFTFDYKNLKAVDSVIDNNKNDILTSGEISINAVTAVGLENDYDTFTLNNGNDLNIKYGYTTPSVIYSTSENYNKGATTILAVETTINSEENPELNHFDIVTASNDTLFDGFTYLNADGKAVNDIIGTIAGSAYTEYRDQYNLTNIINSKFQFHNIYTYDITTSDKYAYVMTSLSDELLSTLFGILKNGDFAYLRKQLAYKLNLSKNDESFDVRYGNAGAGVDYNSMNISENEIISNIKSQRPLYELEDSAKKLIEYPLFLVKFQDQDYVGIFEKGKASGSFQKDNDRISDLLEWANSVNIHIQLCREELCMLGIKDNTGAIHIICQPFPRSQRTEVETGIYKYLKSLYFVTDEVQKLDNIQTKSNLNYIIAHKKLIDFNVVTYVEESANTLVYLNNKPLKQLMSDLANKVKNTGDLVTPEVIVEKATTTYPIQLQIDSKEPKEDILNQGELIVDEKGYQVQQSVFRNRLYVKNSEGKYVDWTKEYYGVDIYFFRAYNPILQKAVGSGGTNLQTPLHMANLQVKNNSIEFTNNVGEFLFFAVQNTKRGPNKLMGWKGLETGWISLGRNSEWLGYDINW